MKLHTLMAIRRLLLSVFNIAIARRGHGRFAADFLRTQDAPNKSNKIQFCINAQHVTNSLRPAAEIQNGQSENSKIECML